MAKYIAQHSRLQECNCSLGYVIEKLHKLTQSGDLPEEANKEVTAVICMLNKSTLRVSTAARLLIEADAATLSEGKEVDHEA